MSKTFYLKTVCRSSPLRPEDCLTVLREDDEPFVVWLGTCVGTFSFETQPGFYEYDYRSAEHHIFITYAEPADAVAHKLRWHRGLPAPSRSR